jgi:hypothetical protein
MKKTVLLLTSMALAAFAYVDTDLDGVEDTLDCCPQTPMTEFVDADGCPVGPAAGPHRFDLIAGITFNEGSRLNIVREGEDTTVLSLQADYYYKQFSVQLATSVYDAQSSSGLNDTLLTGYYSFQPSEKLLARVGLGVILPTYDTGLDNEAADYQASAALSYTPGERFTLFGGVSYTLVNDKDVKGAGDLGDVTYQDTPAFTAGAGYSITPKLYASLSYFRGESIYRDVEAIENLSLYGVYTLSETLFTTFNYAAGLSDSASDNVFALRIGRYF